jgi:hypothetical protein
MFNQRVFLKTIIVTFCITLIIQLGFAQNNYDLETEVYPKLSGRQCAHPLAGQHSCKESITMKAYIEALKDSGVSKDDIFLKVAKKYSLDTILDKDIKARVEKELIKDFGDKRPQIVIEPKTHNFGQVLRSQGTVTNIFKIKNKGNSELIINNVYAACPCTSVSIKVDKYESPVFNTTGAPKDWQVKLQPGKTAELKVVLDLNHKSVNIGKVSRKVLVLSNDPLYPSASATISAEVGR